MSFFLVAFWTLYHPKVAVATGDDSCIDAGHGKSVF